MASKCLFIISMCESMQTQPNSPLGPFTAVTRVRIPSGTPNPNLDNAVDSGTRRRGWSDLAYLLRPALRGVRPASRGDAACVTRLGAAVLGWRDDVSV